MAMYRCAACGSDKVVVGTLKDGYSFKKGALGVAVFGAVGAVAGLDGKKHESYKCMACGIELAEPMDQVTKWAIDDCVNSVNMRQMHNWPMLKYRYPNIESGYVDQVNRGRENSLQAYTAQVIKEEQEKITYFRALTDKEIDEEEKRWHEKADAVHEIFLERHRKAIQEWEDSLEDRVAAVKKGHEEEKTKRYNFLNAAEQKREQLKIELAGIKGLFTGKKKAALQEEISKAEKDIAFWQERCDKLPATLEHDLKYEQEDSRPSELGEQEMFSEKILFEFGIEPSPHMFRSGKDYALPTSAVVLLEIAYRMRVLYRIVERCGRIREKEYKEIILPMLERAGESGALPCGDWNYIIYTIAQTRDMEHSLIREEERISEDEWDFDNELSFRVIGKRRTFYTVKR